MPHGDPQRRWPAGAACAEAGSSTRPEASVQFDQDGLGIQTSIDARAFELYRRKPTTVRRAGGESGSKQTATQMKMMILTIILVNGRPASVSGERNFWARRRTADA